MKKKVFIGLGVILALFIGLVAYYVVIDLKAEDRLVEEFNEINDLANASNIDLDEIYERLNRTITNGDYKVVEEAGKNYLRDSFDNSIAIAKILNDETILNSLTAENYEEDGPDFIVTRAYLSAAKTNLEDYKNKYYEFFTDEKAMSYIESKNLDEYYVDFYRDKLIGDMSSFKEDTTVEESINDVIKILVDTENVINFLVDNKGKWHIEDDLIVFSEDSLLDKYNDLLYVIAEDSANVDMSV